MSEKSEVLNVLLVELFNHILYLEEQNLQSEGIDLTMSEIHTLEAIRDVDEPTISSVAKKLMITLGTMTTATKKLEQKGYLTKIRDQQDARIVRLALKQKAHDVLEPHDRFHATMIENILNNLNKEEEDVLLRSLVKIQNYFVNHDEY